MLQEQLLAIINTYNSDGYYKYGEIPSKKLENAIQYYPVNPNDTPLALIDSTVFGSAKTGMVIGLKGVYWKNASNVKTGKNFLSWEDLSKENNSISKTTYDLQLSLGCEFGMSGSSMKKDLLINLLNQMIDLYKNISLSHSQNIATPINNPEVAVIENKASTNLGDVYSEVLTAILAFCMIGDNKIEEEDIDLITELLENDEEVQDNHLALVSLMDNIDVFLPIMEKSKGIFKLKANTVVSKIQKLDNNILKERIVVILETLLETIDDAESSQTYRIINSLKKYID